MEQFENNTNLDGSSFTVDIHADSLMPGAVSFTFSNDAALTTDGAIDAIFFYDGTIFGGVGFEAQRRWSTTPPN